MSNIDVKSPVCKPPAAWWITALAVEGVTAEVYVLFKTLQGKQLLMQQQPHAFDTFNSHLRELAGLIRLLKSFQGQAIEPDTLPCFMNSSDSTVVFAVSTDNVISFIRGRISYTATEAVRAERRLFGFYCSSA